MSRRRRPRGSCRHDSLSPPRRRSPLWLEWRERWSWEERQQAGILAERAQETEFLAQTVRSLKVRLDALDAAQSRDDLTDLRRSVGDMKSTAVSTREFNTALAVFSQRVDKLGNEEGAKVDKLSERVDHEGKHVDGRAVHPHRQAGEKNRRAAPFRRPDRSDSRSARRSSGPAFQWRRPGRSNGRDLWCPRYRPRRPERRRTDRRALRSAGSPPGRFSAGAGRVERIEFRGGRWTVLTSEGLIASADLPPY